MFIVCNGFIFFLNGELVYFKVEEEFIKYYVL